MKTFINKTILAVVVTVLVAGTAFFASCNKDDEVKVDSTNDTTVIEEKVANTIDIVTIKGGKKYRQENGIYDCKGLKGVCVLFFGGLMTIEPMDFTPDEPCSYATLKIKSSDTLQMTVYFGKATEAEQISMLEDVNEGYLSVSEDVFIDHEDLLEHWNMTNPIVLTPGKYKIEDYDSTKSSFSLTVPYETLEN